MFYFHPCLGKIPILTNFFQMGWNHQLVKPLCLWKRFLRLYIVSREKVLLYSWRPKVHFCLGNLMAGQPYPPTCTPLQKSRFFFVTGLLKWKAMGFHGCQDAMIIPEKFQPGFFGGSPQKSCKDNKSQQASDGFFSDTYKLSSWTYLYNETNMAGIGQRLAPKFEPFLDNKNPS